MAIEKVLVEQRALIALPFAHHAIHSRLIYLNRISDLGWEQGGVFLTESPLSGYCARSVCQIASMLLPSGSIAKAE